MAAAGVGIASTESLQNLRLTLKDNNQFQGFCVIRDQIRIFSFLVNQLLMLVLFATDGASANFKGQLPHRYPLTKLEKIYAEACEIS
jgi:hypothetical protein